MARAEACFDGVDPEALAQSLGTPLYAYSVGAIGQRIAALQSALEGLDAHICYAVKANPSRAVLELMQAAGLGADIVSAGELERCLRAGIAAELMVFSGVGKSAAEISTALAAGVGRFNVESAEELELLAQLAAGRADPVHASIRINPDVDARTHAKISTGKAENKFGVSLESARACFARAKPWPQLQLDGLHVHIGSQLLDLEPLRRALQRVAAFRRELCEQGHDLNCIDVGGGLGVRYREGEHAPTAKAYAAVLGDSLANFDGRILLEPGRWLMAEAGVLLTRVLRVKRGRQRDFLVLDAAMNDLARPSLYDAWHDITPRVPEDRPMACYDVVGPVCETGDTFARQRRMRACQAGDLVVIGAAGAYGASMASTYNSRTLAAEVMLEGGRYALIRTRQSMDAMLAGEQSAHYWETT